MKYIAQIIVAAGLMFFTSGCSNSAQGGLSGLNGNGCNNPRCQCPKPCQCGAGCRCGMNGNVRDMNSTKN